jgi:hypothetical protein
MWISVRQYNNLEGYKLENTKKVDKLDKIKIIYLERIK